MVKSKKKGEQYYLAGKVKQIWIDKHKVIYRVLGDTHVHKTTYYRKDQVYECDCKQPYIGVITVEKYPFCCHCWAIIFAMMQSKIEFSVGGKRTT